MAHPAQCARLVKSVLPVSVAALPVSDTTELLGTLLTSFHAHPVDVALGVCGGRTGARYCRVACLSHTSICIVRADSNGVPTHQTSVGDAA